MTAAGDPDDSVSSHNPPAGDNPGPAAGEPAPVTPSTGSSWSASRGRRGGHRARKAAKPKRKAPWWELPALVLLAILIAIVVKTFIVQPFYIPSQSMEKTLHGCQGCQGDRILVNKIIYDFRDPEPGDIVVFHAPQGWDDEPVSRPPSNPVVRVIRGFGQLVGFVPPDGQVLVKRVIASGGQTVKGDAQGHVMVSTHGPGGPYRTLNEPFVFIDQGQAGNIRAFGPVTVPAGRLWVMGDHRNDSADSRYHCGAGGTDTGDDATCDATASTVAIDRVIGKAFVIAWPPSRWRTLGTPATFEQSGALGAAALDGTAGPAGTAASAVAPAAAMVLTVPMWALRRRRR